jgi:hypothetical protein
MLCAFNRLRQALHHLSSWMIVASTCTLQDGLGGALLVLLGKFAMNPTGAGVFAICSTAWDGNILHVLLCLIVGRFLHIFHVGELFVSKVGTFLLEDRLEGALARR